MIYSTIYIFLKENTGSGTNNAPFLLHKNLLLQNRKHVIL